MLAVLVVTGLIGAPGAAAQSGSGPLRATVLAAARDASARGDHAAAFAAYRALYDPADELVPLAGMAAAANALGELPVFRAVLDSLIRAGVAGPGGHAYWGALALQAGLPADSVAAVLVRYVGGGPVDGAAVATLFRVLIANSALDAAEALLDAAVAGGLPPADVAAMRGEVQEARGDHPGALDRYLEALVAGEGSGVPARIVALLERWPETSPIAAVAERLERARRSAPDQAAGLLLPLIVQTRSAAGDWGAAMRAAQDPVLAATQTGGHLRAIAAAARAAGAPAAARQAIETLLDLGPSVAQPSDRLVLAELAQARGDSATAAAERRRAAGDADTALAALAAGDLVLAEGRPDSALAAYARAAADDAPPPVAIEALARARLVQALMRAGTGPAIHIAVGRNLVGAPAGPSAAAAGFDSLAAAIGDGDSLGIARSLLAGLAGEWRGRAGDPVGASATLEQAARADTGGEAAGLLLAAGRWAEKAGDGQRAAALLREVVERYGGSPYALEARRLLAVDPPSGNA